MNRATHTVCLRCERELRYVAQSDSWAHVATLAEVLLHPHRAVPVTLSISPTNRFGTPAAPETA